MNNLVLLSSVSDINWIIRMEPLFSRKSLLLLRPLYQFLHQFCITVLNSRERKSVKKNWKIRNTSCCYVFPGINHVFRVRHEKKWIICEPRARDKLSLLIFNPPWQLLFTGFLLILLGISEKGKFRKISGKVWVNNFFNGLKTDTQHFRVLAWFSRNNRI